MHPLSFEAHPQFVAAKSLIEPPICRNRSDSKIYLQSYPMQGCLDSCKKIIKKFKIINTAKSRRDSWETKTETKDVYTE